MLGRDVPVAADAVGLADPYGYLPDPAGRERRARRICEALVAFGDVDLARARVLDIGCWAGLIANEISTRAAEVVGVDVDVAALTHARRTSRSARFVAASGARLPFADGTFDAVVCNHVYEHVRDPIALMRETARVLRPGGACYVAAGHTLQVVEPHHRLPFLSWLPRRVAGAWLRAAGRAERYEERFVPPWRLRALFSPFASAELVSPQMLRAPERFGFPALARLPRPLRRSLGASSAIVARLAPTWIYVARKAAARR